MTTRVCLVGTGFIASAHAEAIRLNPALSLAGVIDSDLSKARRFAASWSAKHCFGDLGDALDADRFDRIHVLVPPPAHANVARPFVEASLPVFVEKPLATSTSSASELLAATRSAGATLGVNQNALWHPAFAKLQRQLDAGSIGRLEYVDCLYHAPLRQLQARQFGHWMFAEPKNMLLEQAVHPLSQLVALAGSAAGIEASTGPVKEIAPGVAFYSSTDILLQCSGAMAHLRFAVGMSFPIWQLTAVGTDGAITADMINNRVIRQGRSRWIDAVDRAYSGIAVAGQTARQSLAEIAGYASSMSGLRQRSDSFFKSMRDSIAAFHSACDTQASFVADGAFGAGVVTLCERIADIAFKAPPVQAGSPKRTRREPRKSHEVTLLGGTGFIGQAVLRRLLDTRPDMRVAVMARNVANLPAAFAHENIDVIAGDAGSESDVARAIDGAACVVNLAHGGGGDNWREIESSMVGSARIVASRCLSQKVGLLIHVGSIAGLYLGDARQIVTGETLPDAEPHKRAPYARGKAVTDNMLMKRHREEGLPVCVLRPGLVVGEGASPFHSGVGLFNNEQHCMGWNSGRNPLPFVLVDDVADAIVSAIFAPGLAGRAFNLVGDVKLTAREYIGELGRALNRPLRFHGQSTQKIQLVELSKWGVKRFAGRTASLPSYRDLRSRGLQAVFDCSDVKAALDWHPENQTESFVSKASRQ